MADPYDALAKRLGIPLSRIPDWRQAAGLPPAPSSYEDATLQQYMPQAPAAPAPPVPTPPRPSYEGATLQAPSTAGVSLADPPRTNLGTPARPRIPLATGDNVAASQQPAQLSPSAMAQAMRVAEASEKTKENVKEALDEDERRKNLEGATFYEPGEGAGMTSPVGTGGAGVVMVDPGGRRPKSWQVHEGIDLGPEAEAALANANERGYKAAQLDYEAGQRAAAFERGYLEKHQKAAEKFASEETERAQKYQAQVDATMARLEEMRARIREMQEDPLAGMRSGPAQFLGAIAVALGAFASRGGENQGLAALKHQIDTIIRRQDEQAKQLERGVRTETNYLGALKQAYGDERVAREAAYIAYLERAKVELAKELGDPSIADPRMLAAYNRLLGKLDDELIQRTTKFKQLTEDRVIRNDVMAQPHYVGAQPVGAQPSKKAETDARYLSEAYEKAGLPAALSQLKDIDRLIDAIGDGPIEGIGPVASRLPVWMLSNRGVATRQAVQALKNAIGHSLFGGAISEGEAEKLNTQLEGAKDAASLRRVVQSYRQMLQHRAANIAAGASPEGILLYEQRGGSVQRGAPSRRQIAPDKPTVPTIREAK